MMNENLKLEINHLVIMTIKQKINFRRYFICNISDSLFKRAIMWE